MFDYSAIDLRNIHLRTQPGNNPNAPFVVSAHKELVRPHLVRSAPTRSSSSSSESSETLEEPVSSEIDMVCVVCTLLPCKCHAALMKLALGTPTGHDIFLALSSVHARTANSSSERDLSLRGFPYS
jgi:hypothetical protein